MSTMYIDNRVLSKCLNTLEGLDFTANGGKYQHVGLAEFAGRNVHVRLGWSSNNHNPNNKEYDGLYRWFRLLSVKNQKAERFAISNMSSRNVKDDFGFVPFRKINTEKVSMLQLIKHLEAIQYNLDDFPDTELNEMIDRLKTVYIHSLQEYNDAKWGI